MNLGNKQIKKASLELKEVLTLFFEEILLLEGSSIAEGTEEKLIRKYRTLIIKLFVQQTNFTEMGSLRGYIRNMSKELIASDHAMIGNETMTDLHDQVLLDTLRHLLGISKHAMNGVNILIPNKCQYSDTDEAYKCNKDISFGFTHCKDHYLIVKMQNEDK